MGAPWLISALEAVGQSLGALDLLVSVQHEAWIGADSYSHPLYAAPVSLLGKVQEGTTQIRSVTGETFATRACISFFAPIAHNGAADRREPIDPRDRFTITLENGQQYTGPIVDNVGAQLISTELGGVLRPVHSVWLR